MSQGATARLLRPREEEELKKRGKEKIKKPLDRKSSRVLIRGTALLEPSLQIDLFRKVR